MASSVGCWVTITSLPRVGCSRWIGLDLCMSRCSSSWLDLISRLCASASASDCSFGGWWMVFWGEYV